MEHAEINPETIQNVLAAATENTSMLASIIGTLMSQSGLDELTDSYESLQKEFNQYKATAEEVETKLQTALNLSEQKLRKADTSTSGAIQQLNVEAFELRRRLEEAQAHVRTGQREIEVQRARADEYQLQLNAVATGHGIDLKLFEQREKARADKAAIREEHLVTENQKLRDALAEFRNLKEGALMDELLQLRATNAELNTQVAAEKARADGAEALAEEEYKRKLELYQKSNTELSTQMGGISRLHENAIQGKVMGLSKAAQGRVIELRDQGNRLYNSGFILYHFAADLINRLAQHGETVTMPALEKSSTCDFIKWISPEGSKVVTDFKFDRSSKEGVFDYIPKHLMTDYRWLLEQRKKQGKNFGKNKKPHGQQHPKNQGPKKNKSSNKPQVVDSTRHRGDLTQSIDIPAESLELVPA